VLSHDVALILTVDMSGTEISPLMRLQSKRASNSGASARQFDGRSRNLAYGGSLSYLATSHGKVFVVSAT
jgi:hypothetical protein